MKKTTVLWLCGLLVGVLRAQVPSPVRLETRIFPESMRPGGKGELVVTVVIAPGTHISDPSNGLFAVVPDTVPGISCGIPVYPPGIQETYNSVYKEKVDVRIPLRVSGGIHPGKHIVPLQVTVQQCGEAKGVCYPPEDVRVEAILTVAGPPVDEGSEEKGIAGRVTGALERGSAAAFLLVFLGGLLTSFTPCVYPMIPITMAVIGAQASGKRFGGFILSLFYVLGISSTFSVLGMAAAKTGSLFGAAMGHPVVLVLISAIFFLMGLSMLGAFVMQMPPALAARLRGKKRTGFLGAFLTGILAGLVVSPCISPLLVVILTWVAKKGSLFLGFGLLFSFALGLGVLFIVIGTFSGALRSLPKTGIWMELVERGFGVLLVALAIVFLKPVLPPFQYVSLWAVVLFFAGTFLGAFTPLETGSGTRRKLAKTAAVLLVVLGGILLHTVISGKMLRPDTLIGPKPIDVSRAEGIPWVSSEPEALKQSRLTGTPVLIDFFAEWCAACRELDVRTWPDPLVRQRLVGFIPVKLDMTKKNEATQAAQKKYGILGMPTVLILSPEGTELGRFTGFRPADEVAEFLRSHAR